MGTKNISLRAILLPVQLLVSRINSSLRGMLERVLWELLYCVKIKFSTINKTQLSYFLSCTASISKELLSAYLSVLTLVINLIIENVGNFLLWFPVNFTQKIVSGTGQRLFPLRSWDLSSFRPQIQWLKLKPIDAIFFILPGHQRDPQLFLISGGCPNTGPFRSTNFGELPPCTTAFNSPIA
jgi:hypothetical protein